MAAVVGKGAAPRLRLTFLASSLKFILTEKRPKSILPTSPLLFTAEYCCTYHLHITFGSDIAGSCTYSHTAIVAEGFFHLSASPFLRTETRTIAWARFPLELPQSWVRLQPPTHPTPYLSIPAVMRMYRTDAVVFSARKAQSPEDVHIDLLGR